MERRKGYLITEVGKNTNRATVDSKGKRDVVYILKIPREDLREYIVNSYPNPVG